MATQSIPAFRENSGTYIALRELTSVDIIGMAKQLLADQFQRDTLISSPSDSRDYLISQLADLEHEVFAVLFLDNRHRVISFDHLFNGTIDGASVHPREVVKRALRHNAAAVILTHNHPSGVPERWTPAKPISP
jgi:DNA repair protein RadC